MSFILLGILNSQAAGAVAGAGDYELLETTTLTASASSVSFTGLGAYTDYKHLQIRGVARGDRTELGEVFNMTINGDTSASYARHYLQGDGSSVSSNATTSDNEMLNLLALVGANADSDTFSALVIDILDFASTTKNTTVRALSGHASSTENRLRLGSGLYNNTSAVTSVSLFGEFNDLSAGSRFSLYGLKESA